MDHDQIAHEIGTVLGRPVRYEPIEYDEFARMLSAMGMGPHLVQHLRHVSQDYRNGLFAGTTDVVERIGKKTPSTVAEFVEQHRAVFDRATVTPSGHPA